MNYPKQVPETQTIQTHRAEILLKLVAVRDNYTCRQLWPRIGRIRENIKNIPKTEQNHYVLKKLGAEIHEARQCLRAWPVYEFHCSVKLKDRRYSHRTADFFVEWNPALESKIFFLRRQIHLAVQQARQQTRHFLPWSQPIVGVGGGVLEWTTKKRGIRVLNAPQQILNLHIKKNMQELYKEKRPDKETRYVGIELEFCAPIEESKFALLLFQSGIYKFAQLKHDGSLRPRENEQGYELAILLKEGELRTGMRRVCNLLKQVKAETTDRRCGLHVHIDMRRRNKDVVYNNFISCQSALLKLVHPQRRNNEFCRVVTSKKFPVEFTGERHERYRTINAAAYYKYRTLEIRMHEGSVDYDQIINWVGILIRVANVKEKIKNNVNNLTSLKKRAKLNKKLHDYAVERSCYFQVNNPVRQTEIPLATDAAVTTNNGIFTLDMPIFRARN